jgi:ribosomal protein L29
MSNDLGTIGIAIEVRGKEALRQIESDITSVDRTAKSASKSMEVFEKVGLKAAETFSYMADETKRWLQDQRRILDMQTQSAKIAEQQATSQAKATQEIIKQRQAAEQLATANAKAFQASVGRNLGLGAQGVSASASASAMEAEIERLRMKYDQTYVAAQLYEKSLTELNQAHMLGVTSTRQHEAAVESLRVEYQAFQAGVAQAGNRFAQYTAQSASGMNQFGVVTQQAGYQIGDFLVQVQSGTNWMVAFGQQATQLVGILPLMGAGFMGLSAGALVALSAGLGIAIPLVTAIGAAFMRTSENASSGAKGVDSYSSALQALTSEIQKNQEAFLKLKFDTESSGIAQSKQQAEELRREISSVTAQIDALTNALRNMGPEGALFSLLMGDSGKADLEARLVELEKQLFTVEAQAEAQQMLNGHLSAAAGTQARLADEKMRELQAAKDLEAATINAHQAYAASRMEANQTAEQVALIESGMSQAAVDALRFAGVDLSSGVSAAAREAAVLAANMGIALSDAISIMNMRASEVYSGRGGDPRDFMAGGSKSYSEGAKPFVAIAKAASGAAKSISDAEKAAKDLQKQLDQPLVSAVGSISDAFGDFVARGLSDFKGFVKSILASFKNMIAQMIAMAVKNRIMLSLGIGGLTPGMAAAGQIPGIGAAGGMLGSFGGGAGMAGLAGGTGFLGGFGNVVGGLASGGLAGAGGAIGGALGSGSFAMAAGAIAAPLLAVAAVFSFFKKKTKELDSGLRITVTNMDALVKSFQTIQTKRFWGLSKKTTTTESEVSAEISDPIVEAVQKMQTQIVKAAELFGISSDAFENFVYDFEVSLKGLTEEQKIQKINEEILKMGDAFTVLSGKFTSMNELLVAAQQRYDITTRLLQLQGKEEELLARQRELELAAVHELNRALLQQVYALEDFSAAVSRAVSRTASASSNLRGAMDREISAAAGAVGTAKDALQKAIENRSNAIRASMERVVSSLEAGLDSARRKADASRQVFDALDNALRDRSLIPSGGEFANRQAAMSYLTGGGTDAEKLTSALSVLSEPSEQLFGSFQDYARDFAKTTNAIQQSRDLAEATMSADERTVVLMESQIEQSRASAERQIQNLQNLLTVNEEVLTVEQALEEYLAAQATYEQVQKQHEELLAQFPQLTETFMSVADAILELKSAIAAQTSAQNALNDMLAEANAVSSVPAFAAGGVHSGGMRLVGESGPELEVTGPSRIYSNRDTANMFRDPQLATSVDDLRREVSGMRSEQLQIQVEISKNVKRVYDIERKWDTDGLPPERV